jgi:hypothetical protein
MYVVLCSTLSHYFVLLFVIPITRFTFFLMFFFCLLFILYFCFIVCVFSVSVLFLYFLCIVSHFVLSVSYFCTSIPTTAMVWKPSFSK